MGDLELSAIEALLYVGAVLAALAAVTFRDLLAAVAALGAYSFFIAVVFAAQGAVDVAFTEVAVGAGVTGLFFIAAVFFTQRRSLD